MSTSRGAGGLELTFAPIWLPHCPACRSFPRTSCNRLLGWERLQKCASLPEREQFLSFRMMITQRPVTALGGGNGEDQRSRVVGGGDEMGEMGVWFKRATE